MANAQEQMILKHLQRGRGLTPLQALEKWGCFRLGARVFELKQQGHKIKTEMVKRNGKRFARYTMEVE